MARLLCLCLAALALLPATASAQVERSDVEDEVMCPICGTLLELSDSPQARREKAFIAEMIAAGKSKAEIAAIFERFHDLVTGGASADPGDLAALGKLEVLAGVREFPARVKCATLVWHALLAALERRDEPVSTE